MKSLNNNRSAMIRSGVKEGDKCACFAVIVNALFILAAIAILDKVTKKEKVTT